MRMSPHKVKDLADQIVAMMADHEGIHLNQDETALKVVVGGVILDDLEEEDDIDREVDELIKQHASEIAQDDIDVDILRRKFRSEIARRRGVVLGGGALRLSEERIEVISNLVLDAGRNLSVESGEGGTISFVGRVSPEKGIDDFLAAAAALPVVAAPTGPIVCLPFRS